MKIESFESIENDSANKVLETLRSFGVDSELDGVVETPFSILVRVRLLSPKRMTEIREFEDDLCLALGIERVEIYAPIYGTSLIGIRIPRQADEPLVTWRHVALHIEGLPKSTMTVPFGISDDNELLVANIPEIQHVLLAGGPGTGKSSLIETILNALMVRNGPERLQLLLCDTSKVQYQAYQYLPHNLTDVLTDEKKMTLALKWLGKEMVRRYNVLHEQSRKNIQEYHEWIDAIGKGDITLHQESPSPEAMPYIVVVLDRLDDMVRMYPREIQASLTDLIPKGSRVGIHLVLAAHRATNEVLPSSLKAMIQTRIAFRVESMQESKAILQNGGAETLRGPGEAYFWQSSMHRPVRFQAAYTDSGIIEANVEAVKKQYQVDMGSMLDFTGAMPSDPDKVFGDLDEDYEDDLYAEAERVVREVGKASTSFLQRKMGIGYSRSARLMDLLERRGVVGPADGSAPREVLNHENDEVEWQSMNAVDPYQEAKEALQDRASVSVAFLQRKLGIGYGAARKIMDKLELNGLVGPANGSKPRKVLKSEE